MKMRTFLLIVLTAALPLSAAQMKGPINRRSQVAPAGPTINVLLEKDAKSALVEAKGSYKVVRKDSGAKLSSGLQGKRFVMEGLQQGLRWGEEYPDVYQISVIPTSPETTISINGIQYKGAISVYHTRNNNITLVNEVPIEEYLKSTLAVKYEEGSVAPEAMAALAIIARSEAYAKALQKDAAGRPWDVSAREIGYYGSGVTLNEVAAAIDWTRYMVLESHKDNTPVADAYLSPTKADELAQKGYDAQRILKSSFPTAKIGATISSDEVSVR